MPSGAPALWAALCDTATLRFAARLIGASFPAGQVHDSVVTFRIVGSIRDVQTFAAGSSIRELARLRRVYGPGAWRKRKGIALVDLGLDDLRRAELHWYEATGIGRREMKIKRFLDLHL